MVQLEAILGTPTVRHYVTQMEAVKFGIQLSRTAIGKKALGHACLLDVAEIVMFMNTVG